jgi:DNA-binding MarR family transcriptional regulator
MSSVPQSQDGKRQRRRSTTAIKESLRELSIQLSLLNHQVGGRLGVKDADFDCLDLINRYGPMSPSALARRAGQHPATMTGVLDRLERAGWIARERDPADRRAVQVHALKERNTEIFQLYTGMNAAMDDLCAGYDEAQLELLAGFLDRVAAAGRQATDALAEQD